MGNKMKRKIERAGLAKKKKEAQTDINEKVGLFFQLPDECTNCHDPFDKTNKDMLSLWNVCVRQEEKKVNLYCPPCWEKANKIIEDFNKRGTKDDN